MNAMRSEPAFLKRAAFYGFSRVPRSSRPPDRPGPGYRRGESADSSTSEESDGGGKHYHRHRHPDRRCCPGRRIARPARSEGSRGDGLTSTADILNTVPSILKLGSGDNYAGGQAQQGNTLTAFTYSKSPNIRGLGVGATLSLVNGHRVPYEGANMNIFDGDNYPAQMIQRIDVVQDSGSALYGADAIAGTVNYILRRPERTLEAYGGYRKNDGQEGWYVTGIAGMTWGDGGDFEGGIIASYQHSRPECVRRVGASRSLQRRPLTLRRSCHRRCSLLRAMSWSTEIYYGIPAGQDGKT